MAEQLASQIREIPLSVILSFSYLPRTTTDGLIAWNMSLLVLDSLAVLPAHQAKGYGIKLMNAILDDAQRHCLNVALCATPSNPPDPSPLSPCARQITLNTDISRQEGVLREVRVQGSTRTRVIR